MAGPTSEFAKSIVKTAEQRIRQIMKHGNIDRHRARKRMEQTDQSRRDFVQ